MSETIICICANLFRIYLVYRFMKVFFEKADVNKAVEFILYGMYFVINTFFYLQFHTVWINVINSLLGIFILSIIYTPSLKKGIFISTLIYVLNLLCDVVATLPFVKYVEGSNTSQILFVVGDLLFLICELLAERVVDIREQEEYTSIPLMLVPVSSIGVIIYMEYSSGDSGIEVVIVSLLLLFINFLIMYMYNFLMETLKQSYENEILNQKVEMYANQLRLIIQNDDSLSLLRHDMKHHLSELKFLAQKEDNKNIQAYIDSMEAFIQNPNEIVHSGNAEIDSLLNYMLKKAKERLRTVEVRIQLPEDIVHAFDVNVILANLLENAIEAADMTEDKILRGDVQFSKGVLKIFLENSFNGRLQHRGQRLVTTKQDKIRHGIGLKSVQSIVEKYNGIMEISEKELFGVKIILYISDEK